MLAVTIDRTAEALRRVSESNLKNFLFSPSYSIGFGTANLLNASGGSTIPRYAGGTNFHPGGPAIVGERGPEMVNLPRGSSVTPNAGMSAAVTINIYGQGAQSGREAADALIGHLRGKGVRV